MATAMRRTAIPTRIDLSDLLPPMARYASLHYEILGGEKILLYRKPGDGRPIELAPPSGEIELGLDTHALYVSDAKNLRLTVKGWVTD